GEDEDFALGRGTGPEFGQFGLADQLQDPQAAPVEHGADLMTRSPPEERFARGPQPEADEGALAAEVDRAVLAALHACEEDPERAGGQGAAVIQQALDARAW